MASAQRVHGEKNENQFLGRTAETFLQEKSLLSSGCSVIDSALKGGFSKQGITQIYGQAGTGKSQLALQLCLSVQQMKTEEGNSYGAVYVCTEAAFPVKRLRQMITNSFISKQILINTDLIFIEHIESVDDMETYLNTKLPVLLNAYKIGVIVVDSIAAPFTVEYESDDLKSRAISLRKIGFQLHNLSRQHNLSVICINQVRADFSNAESELPALGITWENAITNSIHLFRNNSKRFAKIVSSPYLPRKTFEYKIHDGGVEGIKEF